MKLTRIFKNQKGQGMMEYMIISAVVGIFCLGAMKKFGGAIEQNIATMEKRMNSDINVSK